MSTLFSKLQAAVGVALTDFLLINQLTGGQPITRRATVLQVLGFVTQLTPNIIAGTAYTTLLSDSVNTCLSTTNGSVVTVTIPPNSQVAYPIGALLLMEQDGAGAASFLGGGGVTVVSSSSLQCRVQRSMIFAWQKSLNNWVVGGDNL